MSRKARPWSRVDIASVQYLSRLRNSEPHRLSLRAIGTATGISHGRIGDLFNMENGAPSLYEFVSLCLLFGHRPATVMEEVMRSLEHDSIQATTITTADERPTDEHSTASPKNASDSGMIAVAHTSTLFEETKHILGQPTNPASPKSKLNIIPSSDDIV